MMENPLISIIIPVYNIEELYLRPCLNSVVNQTYRNLEILIINDGSKKAETIAVLQEFESKDTRIILVNKQNEGPTITRQRGVDLAEGEYIFFIDADDYIILDTIELMIAKAKTKDYDIVMGDYYMAHHGGVNVLRKVIIEPVENGFLKSFLRHSCTGAVWNRLYKSHVLKSYRYFTPQYQNKDNDMIVTCQMTQRVENSKVTTLGIPTYYWEQQRAGSFTNTKSSLDNWYFELSWITNFVNSSFPNGELKNELTLYILQTWVMFITQEGRPKDAELRKKVNTVYMKNEWALSQMTSSNKLLLKLDSSPILSKLYLLYFKYVKPSVKKYFIKIYKK